MPKIALLLCLSISGVATPVFGQEASDEARFSMKAFNLRMSERLLTERVAKPDEASLAFAAIQLWEFQQNIEAFQVRGRDLRSFLFLKEWDSSNRRAVAGGAEELEKVVDDLVAYLGKSIDNGAAAQEAVVSFPNLLGQLSRDVVRILPRLERVVENAQRNLMDARMQGEILEDFGTVKHLCRLLQD
jgi:hypothetical protein